jgi:hypothetical protein
MISEQDLARFKKVFLTKEKAEAFAKKYDLKNYELKQDHEEDVAMLVANMATKQDLRNLEGRFDKIEDNFSIVMNAVDKIAGSLSDLKQEMAFSAVQYARQLEWNHKVGAKVGIPFEY